MNKEEKKFDSDYPYKYAIDFIRITSPWDEIGCGMSRTQGRHILETLSMALGISDKELAEKLADTYLKYEFQVRLLEDNSEKFKFPENAIERKIIDNDEIKWAYWLEPKSDYAGIKTEIRCCGECDFISKPTQKRRSIWCNHPEAKGVKIENELYEIHPDCPIETVKQVTIRHADGKYMWNVKKYLS